jgi:hypothetical protein
MIAKYITKPVEPKIVAAIRFEGTRKSADEVLHFCGALYNVDDTAKEPDDICSFVSVICVGEITTAYKSHYITKNNNDDLEVFTEEEFLEKYQPATVNDLRKQNGMPEMEKGE